MKKFLSVFLAGTLCLSLSACGPKEPDLEAIAAAHFSTCAAGSLSQDDFIANLWAGMEARYEKEIMDEEDLSAPVVMEKAETDRFESYTFTDPELQKLAQRYFKSLDDQENALDTMDPKVKQELYDGAQADRCRAIRDIHALYPLPAGEDAYLLETILDAAEAADIDAAVKQLVEDQFSHAKLVHKGGGEYGITVTNTTDLEIQSLAVFCDAKTADGAMQKDAGMTMFPTLKPGMTQEVTMQMPEGIVEAQITLHYFAAYQEKVTEPMKLTVEDHMKIVIEMPEFPMEFSNRFMEETQVTCRIDEIQVDQDQWIMGEAQVELIVVGEKIYDIDGPEGTHSCVVGCRFYDAEGNLLKESSYIGKGKQGEILRDFPIYIGELKPGTYRVELVEVEN